MPSGGSNSSLPFAVLVAVMDPLSVVFCWAPSLSLVNGIRERALYLTIASGSLRFDGDKHTSGKNEAQTNIGAIINFYTSRGFRADYVPPTD